MKEALKALWENRTERDRIAIGAAAILIAFAIAYAYVWLPVMRERDRLLVRVPELRAEAQAMESDAAELERLKGAAPKSPQDLNATIQQTAVASGITPRSGDISKHGAESARVSIVSAQAAQGFSLVARLQSAHGIRVNHLRMTPLSDGDRVKLEAVFERAPQ